MRYFTLFFLFQVYLVNAQVSLTDSTICERLDFISKQKISNSLLSFIKTQDSLGKCDLKLINFSGDSIIEFDVSVQYGAELRSIICHGNKLSKAIYLVMPSTVKTIYIGSIIVKSKNGTTHRIEDGSLIIE